MKLEEALKKIEPLDETAMDVCKKRWDAIAHPLHSLGKLEDMLVQISGITGSADIDVRKKALVPMCADNGVVEEGVTQTREYGWSDCQDSTSSLTTEKRHFNQGNSTEFSMDICIVCEDTDGNYHRLIHDKRCFPNRYFWNQAPNSRNIREKAKYIKEKGKWTLVREQYLKIKKQYLTSNDYNHSSFICYIEAVNNVYNSRKHWN